MRCGDFIGRFFENAEFSRVSWDRVPFDSFDEVGIYWKQMDFEVLGDWKRCKEVEV